MAHIRNEVGGISAANATRKVILETSCFNRLRTKSTT